MDKPHGIILKGVGGLYCVEMSGGAAPEILICRARGVFRHDNITPLAGDTVIISKSDGLTEPTGGDIPKKPKSYTHGGADSGYVIDEICPRRSVIIRPPLANLSHLFIVIPAGPAEPDLLSADKLCCMAESRGIEPVIVVNKADAFAAMAETVGKIYTDAGFDVFTLSALNGDGTAEIGEYIKNEAKRMSDAGGYMCAAMAGPSGAGKSTLMDAVFPNLSLETGSISLRTGHGRHTTRTSELFHLDVGATYAYIADTPGFSMLDFLAGFELPLSELAENFREFVSHLGKCRYTKCTHTKEEGCAILAAVADGTIPRSRHDNYVTLRAVLAEVPEWKRRKASTGSTGGTGGTRPF